ncbi:hypothetical protein MF272_001091 [Listeria monocytogenes]|uniref:Uncharacterized protein n=2 Tax=Listeria monocytogenes TaxID=1639 RepID=A0AAN3A0V2_LISMN|nr:MULTISPECIES: hypothetical protein [Listeria]MDA44047.1 hypothetical protein [Listeria monocytogenes serotype 1/2a]AEO25582.1 hypothetical protein LMKG_00991 [Listeria monocytogenes FSL R2-561]EAA0313704.1 hypothetical protein [Listeria monocytogenes]EAC2273750.1 hypothetical protein [Listeria monocytogenes]EAC2370028.1 hypothetical protein [Listeria monocytogenes]
MIFIYLILATIISYYTTLVLVTRIKFKQKRMNLSFALTLYLPIYIISVHLKLAYKERYNKPKLKVIMKSMTVEYNVAVVILADIMYFYAKKSSTARANVSLRDKVRETINRLGNGKEYFPNIIKETLIPNI